MDRKCNFTRCRYNYEHDGVAMCAYAGKKKSCEYYKITKRLEDLKEIAKENKDKGNLEEIVDYIQGM